MHRVRNSLLLGALALGTTLVVAAPASAGVINPVVKVSETSQGGYTQGFIEGSLAAGEQANYFFKVKNPGSPAGVVVVRGTDSNNGFEYSYFRKGRDITDAVTTGKQLKLGSHQSKKIEMDVTKLDASPTKDCASLRVTAPPHAEAGVAFNDANCH
jgi:hypothetical protein